MKKSRIIMASVLCVMMAMVSVTQAVAASSVSVSPGDSYIWKITQKYTNSDGLNENMTMYHMINVTAVSQVVESTQITYNDFVANSSAYEGKSLSDVNWNSSLSASQLILNNTAPENSFGGFVNLADSDLTVLNNMTTEEQTELLAQMLLVASPEFLVFALVMTLVAAFSITGNVTAVNSTTLSTVKSNEVAGNLMIGFNIFFDLGNTWWHNMSTTIDFDLRYGSTNKILQENSGITRYNDKAYNDTTNVYENKFIQYESTAKLVYPTDAIESGGVGDLLSQIPGYPMAIMGVFIISTFTVLAFKVKKIKK